MEVKQKMFRKGKTETSTIVLWIIGIAALLIAVKLNAIPFLSFGKDTEDQGVMKIEDVTCDQASVALTVGYAFNKLKPTTALTGTYHRVYINGQDKGNVLDGTSITVAPEDKIVIYAGLSNGTYYAKKIEFTMPCKTVIASAMGDMNLYQATSSFGTTTVINSDGVTKNSASNREALAAGDVKTLTFKITGVYQKAFSPEKEMLMVCNINKTEIDDVVFSGEGISKTNIIPQQHTVGSDYRAVSYLLPSLIGTNSISGAITIDVDDSTNPTNGSITCTFYDADYYRNSITGEVELGYENDQGSDVGTSNPTLTFYYS